MKKIILGYIKFNLDIHISNYLGLHLKGEEG
jgi:hypothetical protein